MSYKAFRDSVIKHLEKYNQWEHGLFNGKGEPKGHIVRIPGKNQKETVMEILHSDGIEEAQLDMFRKPHRYAHHLNSSQVLCYEFFRPLIGSGGVADQAKMGPVLERMGVPAEAFAGAKAEFEKEFEDKEGTNFDFYLGSADGRHHLYVEVKYTEQGFGSCEKNGRHEKKFKNVYRDRLKVCPCIRDDMKGKIDFACMRESYQLFRNVLRVRDEGDYVVFLFPEANTLAKAQFEAFKDRYVDERIASHVIGAHWEDLMDRMGDRLREKFFGFSEEAGK